MSKKHTPPPTNVKIKLTKPTEIDIEVPLKDDLLTITLNATSFIGASLSSVPPIPHPKVPDPEEASNIRKRGRPGKIYPQYTLTPKSNVLPYPVFENSRFANPWLTWEPVKFSSVLRWKLFEKDESNVPSELELDKLLPIQIPLARDIISPPSNGIRATWIGHSTLLVQFDGITILTDPMFSDRASPVSFLGPKRYRKPALNINELPVIHAVVISHNHYDHLDRPSVIKLNERFSNITWCVPRGLGSWMRQANCKIVKELDWWGECTVQDDITFLFTPAQHWCKRSLIDDNMVLWGSWCIIGPWHRFFFAGDTGYCSVFPIIGDVCGPFDLAAIPIGAYEPRWFMRPQHVNPEEAVQIHIDVRAKNSVGIHWGTFNLSYEPYLDPPTLLRNHLIEYGIPSANFFTLKHGESKLIQDMYSGLSWDFGSMGNASPQQFASKFSKFNR